MSRKKRVITEEEIDDNESTNDGNEDVSPGSYKVNSQRTFEELDDSEAQIDKSYTQKIQEFLDKSKLDIAPTFYLYKYDNSINGDAKSLIKRYKDTDPPDEDDIGREFGSGRYLLAMTIPTCREWPKGCTRCYRFKLHQEYDKVRNQYLALSQPAIPVQSVQRDTGVSDMFAMMERFIAMVLPLLQRDQNPDINALMYGNFRNTNEILKRQTMNNLELLKDYQRKVANISTEEDEEMNNSPVQQETTILDQILPLVSEWLPRLINGNTESKALSNVVRSTPQFKQIVSDKTEFKRLITYLDKKEGAEKTDKILAALKLKRE